jgi:hypothetical protein
MRLPASFDRASFHRVTVFACLAFAVIALGGCASAGPKADALNQAQYAWSGAIRWGDFEGAWGMLEPDYRDAHPLTDFELERYRQVQISHYRDNDVMRDLEGGTAMRDVEIGVINRHTQAERSIRYQEAWRWDEAAKRWWLTSGMPDFWQGQ